MNNNRVKKQPTEWQKIFVSYFYNKLLIARMYKGLRKGNNKK